MQRPIVGIFSEPSPLALSIVENLLSKLCKVVIFTGEETSWQEKTLHIKDFSNLEILDDKVAAEKNLDYLIFVDLTEGIEGYKKVEDINRKNVKTLFIFSYKALLNEKTHFERIKSLIKFDQSRGVVYPGDLFGPRMDLDKPFDIKISQLRYPVFIPDVARTAVRWLFSFGPFGEEVLILSKGVGFPKNIRKVFLNTNLSLAIKETSSWFANYQPKIILEKPKTKSRWKRFSLIAFIIIVIISPFLMTVLTFGMLLAAKKVATIGNISWAKAPLTLAKKISVIDKSESLFVANVPLLDKIYGSNASIASTLSDVSDIGLTGIAIYETTFELWTKVLGGQVYDPEIYSQELTLLFDSLYKDISFLQGEKTASILLKNVDLEKVKRVGLNARDLSRELPQLLGAGRPVTYLVLLQNNMELRPTGGFIGSFALVSFDGGRLGGITVDDVYSADGQLRGHVEPPAPIKNYLGEANWYLRDSNWDPDFGVSAGRAEWFLDKEIDKSVDGVVGVDLELAKSLLSVLGPMGLPDFNTQVTDKNLYEKIQSEVETNFFPGSRKKSNFLTALSRGLLERLIKLEKGEKREVVTSTLNSLEEKHIQVFFHNALAQSSISSLGWDGGVELPSCDGNCKTVFLGLAEANVGVNKANYFIKRGASLSVTPDANGTKNQLSLSLENTAPKGSGSKNKYKSYIRLLLPIESDLKEMPFTPELTEVSGRKEVGALVEVNSGERKTIVFNWRDKGQLKFDQPGELRLFWRKQAGTGGDPIQVNFNLPKGLEVGGKTSYNTYLARDNVSRIFWFTPKPNGAVQSRKDHTRRFGVRVNG